MSGEGPRGWGAPLHAAVLDATAVGPGTTLLDLGCGAGLFARTAADRGARVTGVDPDPEAVARAAAEVPGGTFTVGTAEHPPPGPFDVVTAVQLLMHVADPVAVLAAMGRAGADRARAGADRARAGADRAGADRAGRARAGRGRAGPGAVVAATVWGREEECDVRVFGEALGPWLGPRRPAGSPVTEPALLRRMAERAGLAVARLDEVTCPFDYADADELVGPLLASGLGRAVGRRAGPDALREAVLQRFAPYRTATGGYRLINLFRVLVAHRNG